MMQNFFFKNSNSQFTKLGQLSSPFFNTLNNKKVIQTTYKIFSTAIEWHDFISWQNHTLEYSNIKPELQKLLLTFQKEDHFALIHRLKLLADNMMNTFQCF